MRLGTRDVMRLSDVIPAVTLLHHQQRIINKCWAVAEVRLPALCQIRHYPIFNPATHSYFLKNNPLHRNQDFATNPYLTKILLSTADSSRKSLSEI